MIGFGAGRAPAAPVNHLRRWARTGVAAGGGGRWDTCLVEQCSPVAGDVRPFKTGMELSPLLGCQCAEALICVCGERHATVSIAGSGRDELGSLKQPKTDVSPARTGYVA